MITGSHAIIYAQEPRTARAFFRDVLGWPYVDVHDGWLIFRLPPAELGIHPTGEQGAPVTGPPSGQHELYLMCDDIAATLAELTAKGVESPRPRSRKPASGCWPGCGFPAPARSASTSRSTRPPTT